jgi:cytochrome b pre-mRNA-processing protein 3
MLGLLGKRYERTGYTLYGAAVAAARAPVFYGALGVADTLDGRFDLVGLHVYLVIRRLTALPEPGPKIAQAVFDAMFADMDVNLREMGVGDLSVGRKVKEMWEAFHGRSSAYQTALAAGDAPDFAEAALAAALGRNVWRGNAPEGAAAALAAHVLALDAHLATQPLAALRAGQVAFLPLAA